MHAPSHVGGGSDDIGSGNRPMYLCPPVVVMTIIPSRKSKTNRKQKLIDKIYKIMSSVELNQPNDSNTVNDTANSGVDCKEKQIKFKSPMWRHFTFEDVNGTGMAVCKYCRKAIAYTSKNGTNGMHTHHKACKIRIGQKKIDDFQSQLTGKRSKMDESGGSILATHRFNYDDSRTDLAKMITKHDYPLRIVEHDGFRDFCHGLQPLFIYGVDNAKDEIQKVRQICEDIYLRYESSVMSQASNDDVTTSKPTSSQKSAPGSDMDSLDAFFSWNSSTSEVFVKNELERYLEEGTLPRIHEFDVLGWWKLNGVKYPTLCLIAKDILAIPISTVAPESSFSTSGRIVGPHRSRLLPSTIEAIICTQNWL